MSIRVTSSRYILYCIFGKEYTYLRSGEHDFEGYGQEGDDEKGVSDKFGETLLTGRNDFIESGPF